MFFLPLPLPPIFFPISYTSNQLSATFIRGGGGRRRGERGEGLDYLPGSQYPRLLSSLSSPPRLATSNHPLITIEDDPPYPPYPYLPSLISNHPSNFPSNRSKSDKPSPLHPPPVLSSTTTTTTTWGIPPFSRRATERGWTPGEATGRGGPPPRFQRPAG